MRLLEIVAIFGCALACGPAAPAALTSTFTVTIESVLASPTIQQMDPNTTTMAQNVVKRMGYKGCRLVERRQVQIRDGETQRLVLPGGVEATIRINVHEQPEALVSTSHLGPPVVLRLENPIFMSMPPAGDGSRIIMAFSSHQVADVVRAELPSRIAAAVDTTHEGYASGGSREELIGGVGADAERIGIRPDKVAVVSCVRSFAEFVRRRVRNKI